MKEGFGYLVQAVSHYPTLVEKFRRDHAEADLVNAWKTVIAHMAPQDGRTYSAVPGDEREDHCYSKIMKAKTTGIENRFTKKNSRKFSKRARNLDDAKTANRKVLICYKCHGKNHKARVCPSSTRINGDWKVTQQQRN